MKLLTVPEVAERMSLPIESVRTLLRTGELRATKRGRRWLIPETSITQWVQSHTYTP